MQIGRNLKTGQLCERRDEASTRVVLVEAHSILMDGIESLLEGESGLEVVGKFNSVETTLERLGGLQPDLVVTGLTFPGLSGIELIKRLRQHSPSTRSLVLTAQDSEESIRATFNAGADGYLLKDSSCAELLLAIRSVTVGQQFLCKTISSKIVSGYLSGRDPRPPIPASVQAITSREREVLTQVALGSSNKLIARQLGVSPKTVEKHRSNLMRKLGLHNTAAITMFAIRHGMAGGELSFARPPARERHQLTLATA